MLNGEYRVRKLRWKSRRGMKELDVLFEAFFAQQTDLLLTGGWPRLEEVLEQEDTLIYRKNNSFLFLQIFYLYLGNSSYLPL